MQQLFLGFGVLGWSIAIIAGILFFFLPFYVAGIYHRAIKCQKELEKINQSIRIFETTNEDFTEEFAPNMGAKKPGIKKAPYKGRIK